MPLRVWPLWWGTFLVLAGYPAMNFIYWPAVLRAGLLPPDGDTIVIPMFGSIVVTLVASPLVVGTAWLCLRRYNPATRLVTWRKDRPVRTILASLLLGGAAAIVVVGMIANIVGGLPWREHLWTAYAAALSWWLLAMRAAAIEQLGTDA